MALLDFTRFVTCVSCSMSQTNKTLQTILSRNQTHFLENLYLGYAFKLRIDYFCVYDQYIFLKKRNTSKAKSNSLKKKSLSFQSQEYTCYLVTYNFWKEVIKSREKHLNFSLDFSLYFTTKKTFGKLKGIWGENMTKCISNVVSSSIHNLLIIIMNWI